MCQVIDFFIQTGYVFFVLNFFCMQFFFHGIQTCHNIHKLIINTFFIIASHYGVSFDS